MLSETVIRRLEALGEISKQEKPINGLFRLLENPILWHEAYANIYANDGATTPGIDGTTLDGFSHRRVEAIIAQLKDGSYRFTPVRRTYVPKKNGKKRPLGISTGDDKLVQEVVRIILERIYEPTFEDSSHGFRQAMLDAGYLEDWQYHATYSGVPQGSIVSPILANVFLHELDLFMKTMKDQYTKGKKRRINPAYKRHTKHIARLRRKGDILRKEGRTEEFQEIKREIRKVDAIRKRLSSVDPFDQKYKRLYFCRYADDFIIGVIGSHADAETIQHNVRNFIEETLKLTIAEEKSHIRHSKEGTTFVGYEIKTYSGNRIVKAKHGTRHTTHKSVSERIQLHIPKDKLQKFCQTKGYGDYVTTKAIHRKELTQQSDAEIITVFNGELRGLMNYYALAFNVKTHMHKLHYIWERSLLKTLANKHKTSMNKIIKRLKTEEGLILTVQEEKKTRVVRVFRPKDLKPAASDDAKVDSPPNMLTLTLSRSELIKRLNANKCEYCETTVGPFEVHHIRKMKDVAEGKQLWQQMMAARNRKTLVLCLNCHQLLHAGKLPDREHRTRQVKGEPDARKARTSGSVGG